MKDDRLEKEFGEYFKGVNIPNDITADAKKSVTPKRRTLPRFAKIASIAASIVLVFAVSLTVIFTTDFNKATPDNSASSDGSSDPTSPDEDSSSGSSGGSSGGASGDTSSGDGEASAPESPSVPDDDSKYTYYTDSDLNKTQLTANELSSLDSSLKFIENLEVENCSAYYMDGKLALVTCEVDTAEDNTAIFVEFTNERVVYSSLTDFYGGETHYYEGVKYYLNENEDNLLIFYEGVKYYFDIHSSGANAYRNYLNLIIK